MHDALGITWHKSFWRIQPMPQALKRWSQRGDSRLNQTGLNLVSGCVARIQLTAVLNLRTDWRERELVIAPRYSEGRAQTAGVTREDVAATMKLATEGDRAGTFREGSRLIPIIVRQLGAGAEGGEHLVDQPVAMSDKRATLNGLAKGK